MSRFTVNTSGDRPTIDLTTEEVVIAFPQGGHNGADLHFGPDGFLYISTGDAADPNPPDPFKTGTDCSDLLASILRIDVDHKDPGLNYAVPKDNPFVGVIDDGKPVRPEIWSYGYRNPWRMSFDRATGELWVGDVGWEQWEMVHQATKGSNHGWSVVEGRQPINGSLRLGPTPTITPPVIELDHSQAASVNGGYVYRGKKFPELSGKYVFSDYMTKRIWAATIKGDRYTDLVDLTEPTVRISCFGETNDGELYFADYDTGTIHTLERNAKPTYDPKAFPDDARRHGPVREREGQCPRAGRLPVPRQRRGVGRRGDGRAVLRRAGRPENSGRRGSEATRRKHRVAAVPVPLPQGFGARQDVHREDDGRGEAGGNATAALRRPRTGRPTPIAGATTRPTRTSCPPTAARRT